jgi:hypothetical protein
MNGCDNGGGMIGVPLDLVSLILVRCYPGLRKDWLGIRVLEHVGAKYFCDVIL